MTEQTQPTDAAMTPCGDCGMPCAPNEYHPYAACLMFKACHNSEVVRANLDAVRGTPAGATEWKYSKIETRIKELMAGTAYPNSTGVAQAMKQLVNELWQEYGQVTAPASTTPQPTQAQAGAVPQCYQSGSLMSTPDGGMTAHLHFDGSDGVEAWFDAITEELSAHGIKGADHG